MFNSEHELWHPCHIYNKNCYFKGMNLLRILLSLSRIFLYREITDNKIVITQVIELHD